MYREEGSAVGLDLQVRTEHTLQYRTLAESTMSRPSSYWSGQGR
jgi:hypothetical protein